MHELDVLNAMRRQSGSYVGPQIAVRIDEHDGLASFDILQDEVEEQRRFPAARASDDVGVTAGMIDRHANGLARLDLADDVTGEGIELSDLPAFDGR